MEETQRIRQAGCKYGTDVMSFLFTTLLVSILANRCTACAGGGGGGAAVGLITIVHCKITICCHLCVCSHLEFYQGAFSRTDFIEDLSRTSPEQQRNINLFSCRRTQPSCSEHANEIPESLHWRLPRGTLINWILMLLSS